MKDEKGKRIKTLQEMYDEVRQEERERILKLIDNLKKINKNHNSDFNERGVREELLNILEQKIKELKE